MQLFYNDTITPKTENISFNREESKHIVKSLRKKTGDTLHITNGKGYLFTAIITADLPNKCIAKISEVAYHSDNTGYYLHIAIAPTKMNDRLEWFLEKACEIGIQEITPIFCDHSERKTVKIERLEKIIHSACKQSLQYNFPKINTPIPFNEFVISEKDSLNLIAYCGETPKKPLKAILEKKAQKNITIMIGPEGDFSTKEIELATNHKYQPITLGTSRLRTETAGIVAVHSVNFVRTGSV